MNGINEKGRLIEKYLPVDYQDVFLVRTKRKRIIPVGGYYQNILV